MPPPGTSDDPRTLDDIVRAVGRYPVEAFRFVNDGLGYTAEQVHGPDRRQRSPMDCHVTGRELCVGLRAYALQRYGPLAGAVLNRWQIGSTADFGRIVFALVEAGIYDCRPNDREADFRDVYDFARAFAPNAYRIELP